MRNLTILVLFFVFASCNVQNNQEEKKEAVSSYLIGTTTWQYLLPKEFKIREDQFSKTIETGQQHIESKGSGATASKEDVIVISAARSDSSDINALLVSYKNNNMIEQFGLKGFRNKMVEFVEFSFEQTESNFKTEKGEVVIDSKQFYTIENTMYDNENNYLYSSLLFLGEISKKQVSFTLIFDNQQDKELLVNSLINSKFNE